MARVLPSGLKNTEPTPTNAAPTCHHPAAELESVRLCFAWSAVGSLPVVTSHRRMMPLFERSRVAAARVLPSGLKHTEPPHGTGMAVSSLPVAASHRCTPPSLVQPAARVLPSGLHDTQDTPYVCPLRVACSLPVAASHRRTMPNPRTARV